jgi:threonine/homoserine/homoserine lactone efflux protein
MTPETIIIFFISLVLLWLKPGPGQALRLTYALEFGALSAFLISLGVITVCLGYFLFVALGYSAIPADSAGIFMFLKVVGALYLVYLGAKGFLNRHRLKKYELSAEELRSKQKSGALKHYSLGLLMALSNPITIFYYVGILPTLVPLDELTVQDMAIGLVLVLGAGALVDGLLIVLTVLAKEAFASGKTRNFISVVTSVSFILIGLFLLYSAIFHPEGIEFGMI